MTNSTGLYITFWAAPGKIDELVVELQAMVAVTADEEGTLAYGLHRVSGELEGVSVYEIYRDAGAQRDHGASSAIDQLRSRLPELLGAPPERYALQPIPGAQGLPF